MKKAIKKKQKDILSELKSEKKMNVKSTFSFRLPVELVNQVDGIVDQLNEQEQAKAKKSKTYDPQNYNRTDVIEKLLREFIKS